MGDEVTALQARLCAAADAARAFDVAAFEGAERAVLEREVVPAVVAQADEAVAALAAAREHVSVARASGALAGPDGPLPDVLRMACWELGRLRRLVAGFEARVATGVLLSSSCGLRRRVINVTTVVERAFASAFGRKPLSADLYTAEVEHAVAVRTEYARFQRNVQRHLDGEGGRDDVRGFLRLAGTGVTQILGSDAAPHLPMRDRIELRRLHARVLGWMRDGVDPKTGRRLLRDVDAFARLLLEINHRPTLVEHDVGQLERLIDALSTDPLPVEDVCVMADRLAGRDLALDDLLESVRSTAPPPAALKACQEEARRVLRRLLPSWVEPVRAA